MHKNANYVYFHEIDHTETDEREKRIPKFGVQIFSAHKISAA